MGGQYYVSYITFCHDPNPENHGTVERH